ncbi:YjbF family lipoprotein [Vibrio mexicanus]|uniref:YjbF family lipoprotein n=1 Tax=Vibrio mexicanus TaxID=1004326 RepID=UPI000B100C80|nr:YjbF family lipoprotein [Vibrio mexicanus]
MMLAVFSSTTRFFTALPLLLLFSLTGCSQQYQDTNATIKAFWGESDIELSAEEVENVPYASLYVRINDGPQIFMVLAFAEQNPNTGSTRLKWISSDYAMLITENGRIVKTLNLPFSNLVNISSSPEFKSAPLITEWNATYDWQPNHQFNHQANVKTVISGNKESYRSLLWEDELILIDEIISFNELDKIIKNSYWVDNNNQVLRSNQWLVPEQLHVSIEVLKPFSG